MPVRCPAAARCSPTLFGSEGDGVPTSGAVGSDAGAFRGLGHAIAVGGALTEVVDGIVADFEAANPDIKVKAIYAGNYNHARIKALAALKSGQPAQLSVMFSIDIYELIEQDAADWI